MEVVVTTGAIRGTKLQSNRHCQCTNNQLFTGRMVFLSPNHSVSAQKAVSITFNGLAHTKITQGLTALS